MDKLILVFAVLIQMCDPTFQKHLKATQDNIKSITESGELERRRASLADIETTRVPAPSGGDSLCSQHTAIIVQALQHGELWAAQMVDATGRPPSGLLYDGNFRWLGSWQECTAVSPVAYTNGTTKANPHKPFEPRYCSVQAKYSRPPLKQSVTIGMCFPSSCTTHNDTRLIADTLLELRTVTFESATCQTTEQKLTDKAIATIVVCCLIGTLVIVATVFDVWITFYVNKRRLHQARSYSVYSNAVDPISGNVNHQDKEYPNKISEDRFKYKPGVPGLLLLSFSAYSNGRKILNTSQPEGSLTAVHGIRFLSMAWVILGHTFSGEAVDNYRRWEVELIKRWPFQAIANALVSVDSFFLLSGLLISYLTLKGIHKAGGPRRFNWLLFYFHRFWRLTPPYMLVLMVYVTTMKYWSRGPLWSPTGMATDECRDTWWHNLLYVNNLLDSKRLCMPWAWYLGNDMQFFWVSPLMIIPLYYSKLLGMLSCSAFLLTNLISAGLISSHYHLWATSKIDSKGTLDVDKIYIKPWARIGPYVVGIIYGYILYKTNCRPRIPKVVVLVGWVIAAAIALLIIYGPYTSDGLTHMNNAEEAFYNAAGRTGWGVAVGWVAFACATGYGGPVNALLSWSALVPLSRLTYCAYLVHPIILRTYYTSVKALQHWDELELVYKYLGNVCCSMAVAFVVSLAFEAPMIGLERVLLGKFKRR